MSSIRDAIAIPNAVNEIPTRIMKASAIRNPTGFVILRPSSTASTMRMNPWITAVVAPPAVWPSMISSRVTGATSVSFKNPNCLSQMIWMPEKTEVKSTLIATMPGTRNRTYSCPSDAGTDDRVEAEA